MKKATILFSNMRKQFHAMVLLVLCSLGSVFNSYGQALNFEVSTKVNLDTMLIYVTVRNDSTSNLTFGNSNISLTLDDTTGLDFVVDLFPNPDDTLPFYARGRWDAATNAARYLPMTNGITAFGGSFRINLSINQSTFPGSNPVDAEYIASGATDTIAVLYMLINNCTASNKNISFSTPVVGVVRDYFHQYSESTISRVADATASNIVLRPYVPNAVVGDTVVCEGDTIEYSTLYVDGLSYNWTTPSGTSITSTGGAAGFLALDSNNVDVAFPSGSVDGFVKVVKTIIGNGCVLDGDSLFVDFNDNPNFVLSPPSICGNDTAVFVTNIAVATFTAGTTTYTNASPTQFDAVFGNLSGTSRLDSVIAVTAAGCTDTAFITVFSTPVLLPSIDTVCVGESLVFLDSTGLNVEFSLNGVVVDTAVSTSISFLVAGNSIVSVISDDGCVDTSDVLVAPTPSFTTFTLSDCGDTAAGYKVDMPVTFTLISANGTSIATGADTATLSFSNFSGVVAFDTLVATSGLGCADSVEVTIFPAPIIVPSTDTVCSGDTIVFSESTGLIALTYSNIDAFASILSPDTALFTNATANPVLSQITVVTTFGCNDTADVTVNPLPIVTAIAEDDTVCSGVSVTYQVQPFFTGGTYGVLSTASNSISGSTVTFAASNTTVRFDTVFYVASVAQGACVGSTEVLVMPIPSILKGAGLTTGDTTVCDTAVINFTLQGGFVSYTGLALDWYAIDNGNNIIDSDTDVANFGPVGFGSTGGTVVDTVYATYFFNTLGTDENCYDSVLVTINDSYKVDFTAFLQGAYDATANKMRDDLFTGGLLTSEFVTPSPAPRTPAPAIPGITTTSIPASGVVDVVEVSLRNSFNGPIVATEYAWLMENGSVENYHYAGQGVRFCSAITPGNYFIVVSHRNHLDVQSATSVAVSTTMPSAPYDFTQIANVYGGGAVGIDQAPIRFGLVAGNARRTTAQDDGETNANDFYDVGLSQMLLQTGYISTDVNMTGVVNAADFDLSSRNNDFLYFTTVP